MFMTQGRAVHPNEVGLDSKNPEESAYAFLQQCVADAINQGRIRTEYCQNPNNVSNMLWSCVHGVVSLHMVKCHDHYVEWGNPRELAEMMVDTVIRGITAD